MYATVEHNYRGLETGTRVEVVGFVGADAPNEIIANRLGYGESTTPWGAYLIAVVVNPADDHFVSIPAAYLEVTHD